MLPDTNDDGQVERTKRRGKDNGTEGMEGGSGISVM